MRPSTGRTGLDAKAIAVTLGVMAAVVYCGLWVVRHVPTPIDESQLKCAGGCYSIYVPSIQEFVLVALVIAVTVGMLHYVRARTWRP